jgi:hypothetical protein
LRCSEFTMSSRYHEPCYFTWHTASSKNLFIFAWFRQIKIAFLFFFSSPWRSPHKWTKNVSDKYIVNITFINPSVFLDL